MPEQKNRQRMKPISLKLWPDQLTRAERAAAMLDLTLSEYSRRAIERANAEAFGEPVQALPQIAAA